MALKTQMSSLMAATDFEDNSGGLSPMLQNMWNIFRTLIHLNFSVALLRLVHPYPAPPLIICVHFRIFQLAFVVWKTYPWDFDAWSRGEEKDGMYLSKLIKVEVFVSVMDFIAVCCLVASHVQLFCNLMDCSLPDFSVHGIFEAKRLEWVAIFFSRRIFLTWDQTHISCIGRWILYHLSHQEKLYLST